MTSQAGGNSYTPAKKTTFSGREGRMDFADSTEDQLACAPNRAPEPPGLLVQEIDSGEPSDDPLLSRAAMPFVKEYFPLGFRVEVSTNSEQVLAAAEESWACFIPRPHLGTSLRLRIGVGIGRGAECPPRPVFRTHRHMLTIVADAANFVTCDLSRGFAFGWVSEAAVKHRSYLRYHFLEAAILSLLSESLLTPLHAACVERQGCGVLLCGDSGAGKSTLAFACARTGWTYISDDATYLVNGREDLLVVGNSHQFRFRPSATELFPELAGLSITPRAAGKPSIELPTRNLPSLRLAEHSHVDRIVFLKRRHQTPPGLVDCPRTDALEWLAEPVFNAGGLHDAQVENIRRLASLPVYELRYRDLDWAVQRLEDLTEEGK